MPTGKIDVHAHFIPEDYRKALVRAGRDKPDGIPGLPPWDMEAALAAMGRLDVRVAVLSISSPGVHFGDSAAAITLARAVNEAGARIVAERPDRFGLFATLPLPEVDASVAEARYALGTLGADGVVLLTNHRGMYLGDERLDPLYAEIAAQGSVVLVYPTSVSGADGEPITADAAGMCAPLLEFMFEDTRSIVDLVTAGVLVRHPGLRVIVPHGGAALVAVANRFDALAPILAGRGPEVPSLYAALKRLDFDLAGSPVEEQLAGLLSVAGPARLHYGSDFPFSSLPSCQRTITQLEATAQLDPATLDAIYRDNSDLLLPGLAARAAAASAGE